MYSFINLIFYHCFRLQARKVSLGAILILSHQQIWSPASKRDVALKSKRLKSVPYSQFLFKAKAAGNEAPTSASSLEQELF